MVLLQPQPLRPGYAPAFFTSAGNIAHGQYWTHDSTFVTTMAASHQNSELDDFQRLSNDYQPNVEVRIRILHDTCYLDPNLADFLCPQGPDVSQRQPSSALSAEYANADPRYIAKTTVGFLKLLFRGFKTDDLCEGSHTDSF